MTSLIFERLKNYSSRRPFVPKTAEEDEQIDSLGDVIEGRAVIVKGEIVRAVWIKGHKEIEH